jgi:hypothetical protein
MVDWKGKMKVVTKVAKMVESLAVTMVVMMVA